jgi:hypothetical protein
MFRFTAVALHQMFLTAVRLKVPYDRMRMDVEHTHRVGERKSSVFRLRSDG